MQRKNIEKTNGETEKKDSVRYREKNRVKHREKEKERERERDFQRYERNILIKTE